MRLVKRTANAGGNRNRPVGRKRNTVKTRHDRVGIGDPFMHSRRAGAAEQHMAVG